MTSPTEPAQQPADPGKARSRIPVHPGERSNKPRAAAKAKPATPDEPVPTQAVPADDLPAAAPGDAAPADGGSAETPATEPGGAAASAARTDEVETAASAAAEPGAANASPPVEVESQRDEETTPASPAGPPSRVPPPFDVEFRDAGTPEPAEVESEPEPAAAQPERAAQPEPPQPVVDVVNPLARALQELRDTLATTRYTLNLPTAERAAREAAAAVAQLDDYLLPRLRRLDAPLLVVVGGSTGAGKSTLVNSLVRAPVSQSGVLRPTTRAPVLVCNPADSPWFSENHLLPGLARTSGPSADHSSLQVVNAQGLRSGLAFLDAPDIDSVVDANRALATQLLAAADLWLFVTTAARYADAVPWDLLRTARDRGTVVALVLDRVPPGAADEIGPHLTGMLRENGLGGSPLFVLPEATLDGQGLLAERVITPLREWFDRLASSASARAAVVRQTVGGAIDALGPTVVHLSAAADDQVAAALALDDAARAAYGEAVSSVERGMRDGVLLRGEVLSRWQELVGTGELMRALQARVGRARDRIVAALTGRPAPGKQFQAALESGVVTLIRNAAAEAAENTVAAWRAHPAGAALVAPGMGFPTAELSERAERLVRDWQRSVLELVRREAEGKLAFARVSAYAVNATGLLVMVSVFTATAFIPTGLEVATAAGTTVAAQKVLEAIFGDQAVRALADQARTDLLERVQIVLTAESERFHAARAATGVDPDTARRLRDAAAVVARARQGVELPSGDGAVPKPGLVKDVR